MKILYVPFEEKDEAKALGARWNKEKKKWYVPDQVDEAPFERWFKPYTKRTSAPAPEVMPIDDSAFNFIDEFDSQREDE